MQREPFERGLRELGWVPGTSIQIEYRYAEGVSARLDALAAELVRLKVDVIVARSHPVVAAARRATDSIPIVMSSSADPVGSGHVKSLARPGGNVTGIANLTWELEGKRLELLDRILKGANPSELPVEQPAKFELVVNLKAAQALGLTIPQSFLLRADDVIQ